MLKKAPGRVGRLDRKLVRAVSGLPGGGHDEFFRRLSAAANKGKLWIGIAAIMALFPGRTRRAAVHGLLAQAVASAVTNVGFKTLLPRARCQIRTGSPKDLPQPDSAGRAARLARMVR